MNDYRREERTTTIVRHSMTVPVNWVEMQKLLRIVIKDMGYEHRSEPADDLIWYEVSDDEVVICYELMIGSTGETVRT